MYVSSSTECRSSAPRRCQQWPLYAHVRGHRSSVHVAHSSSEYDVIVTSLSSDRAPPCDSYDWNGKHAIRPDSTTVCSLSRNIFNASSQILTSRLIYYSLNYINNGEINFRLHRMQMSDVTCSVVCVSVCLSVCVLVTLMHCAITDEMLFGADSCWSKEPCVRCGQDRINPFAAARSDKSAMQPFAKLL